MGDTMGRGVVWSSEDAHRPQHRQQTANQAAQCVEGVQDSSHGAGIPGARLRASRCLVRYPGLMTIVGPLETVLYCTVGLLTVRISGRVIT
eukprot:8056981-Pyramimonas_sp.AAC.1